MISNQSSHPPFLIRDCALVTIATGLRAQGLREFHNCLKQASADSVYHHLWGRLLQPAFDEPEYNNDFASWARHGLHERSLAERLSVVDPTDYEDIEAVRVELVDIVESFLDTLDHIPYARADQQFHFLRSQIIIFDTGRQAASPEELGRELAKMTPGSIYYHFIDARRRNPGRSDDFSAWLSNWGGEAQGLVDSLRAIDPYFSSLRWLAHNLMELFQQPKGGSL